MFYEIDGTRIINLNDWWKILWFAFDLSWLFVGI